VRSDLTHINENFERIFQLLDKIALCGICFIALVSSSDQHTFRPKGYHFLENMVSLQVVSECLVGAFKDGKTFLRIFHGVDKVGSLGEFDLVKDDVDKSTFL